TRRRDSRGGAGRSDAGIYVRRRPARGRQPVGRQRSGDGGTDEAVLRRDAGGRTSFAGQSAAGRANLDAQGGPLEIALLLGRFRPAGRVAPAMNEGGERVV